MSKKENALEALLKEEESKHRSVQDLEREIEVLRSKNEGLYIQLARQENGALLAELRKKVMRLECDNDYLKEQLEDKGTKLNEYITGSRQQELLEELECAKTALANVAESVREWDRDNW